MISTVGRAYLTSSIENSEYSYPKALSAASLTFAPIQNSAGRRLEKLGIRFEKEYIPTAPYLILVPNAGHFLAISRYIL